MLRSAATKGHPVYSVHSAATVTPGGVQEMEVTATPSSRQIYQLRVITAFVHKSTMVGVTMWLSLVECLAQQP